MLGSSSIIFFSCDFDVQPKPVAINTAIATVNNDDFFKGKLLIGILSAGAILTQGDPASEAMLRILNEFSYSPAGRGMDQRPWALTRLEEMPHRP
jgi:hypothetical protein